MSQNFERSQKFFAEPESILELINNFEVYKPLSQDPKERIKAKADQQ